MTHRTQFDRLNRRHVLALGAGGVAAAVAPGARAQQGQSRGPIDVNVDQANLRPRPIAIPEFGGDDPKMGADVANVVAGNLDRSGLFKPLDRGAFIERIQDINQTPRFADWRSVGAEALVVGRVKQMPDGRIGADFRLWDTVLGRAIDGQGVAAPLQNWRRLGHIIADRVYEKMTLERGYFDTRIVFVDETGPKDRRLKRLAIMDQDGHNVRLLTDGRELALTPRFNPVQQEITYLQYSGQQNRVYVMNLDTGQRSLVSDFSGKTFAPRFSPDGGRLVMSVDEGGAISLVEVDLRSRQPRRLTQTDRIDTGACYSPDGRQIVFESDREGTQQLYIMGAGGGPAQRISRGDGRYSTPVWSPRGDNIAFTKQAGGSFLIGVMRTDGTGERILSSGFHNEGPTWAPNGRVLMFFRESQGANGGPKLYSVDLTGYNERQVPTPAFASDPAWSPLRR
ncbi:MAG TPA: Tol-Pal system beta propeller repeat protein TolB [Hyphomicrobiaceae bacterium]|nr:Tol-Pal system beta propeller repeat protein TolB [Hyphomicrobiaceae bacterium]